MELAFTVFRQVCIMFLLMAAGYLCRKTRLVSSEGKQQMTNILLYLVNPMVVLHAFQMDFDPALARNLGYAFLLGIASHLIAIGLSYLLIRDRQDGRAPIERFSMIYSNCGFMALPLIQALFGSEGVFYASAYLAVFNILSWTHGYILMSGKRDKSALKKAFLSPVVLAVVAGGALFFFRIRFPGVLGESVGYLASLNTPLAMLITGISLAETRIREAFTSPRVWMVMLFSCLLVPAVALAAYTFLPLPQELILVNLVSTACPPAVTTLLFAQKLEKDSVHALRILTLSNVCCIVTIPAIVFACQLLSGIR